MKKMVISAFVVVALSSVSAFACGGCGCSPKAEKTEEHGHATTEKACTKGESEKACTEGESEKECKKDESKKACAKGESKKECSKGEEVKTK